MPEIELGQVPDGSRRLHGYVARPAGAGPWPGVVMIHEAFGLDDVMRRQADRLARAGYLTLAPDLFSDGMLRCLVSTFRALVAGRGKPFGDLEAARQWLLEQGDCTGRVGVLGFCMGGGFALAVADRGFEVSSVNYNPPVSRDLARAVSGACPIVASYGAKDPGATKFAKRLDSVLTEAGIDHDVKVYPNAGHSFLNDAPAGPRALRPLLHVAQIRPEPESAVDAWRRIEEFFERHLGD